MKSIHPDFKIKKLGKGSIDATPVNGSSAQAEATQFQIKHLAGWSIKLAFVEFTTSRDIRCLEVSKDSPEQMHRLCHGLRMSVYRTANNKQRWVELSQAHLDTSKSPPWSNLKRATKEQLERGAGFPIADMFDGLGAEFDSREKLLGDDSRRRFYWCLTFERDDIYPAIIAYIYTRVLPLTNKYRGGELF